MNPQDADQESVFRGNVELVRIRDAEGHCRRRRAAIPAGCAVRGAGEVWGGAVQRYFLALEEGINTLPGFSPELQGVYSERCGRIKRCMDTC
ncbi:hypothetical protein ACNKHS_17630 [Shigella flexneri]